MTVSAPPILMVNKQIINLFVAGQSVRGVIASSPYTKISDHLFRLVELIPDAIFEDGIPLVAARAQVSLPGTPQILADVWVKTGAAADIELGTDLAALLGIIP